MTLTEIKRNLAALETAPIKNLGQNFLHDQNLAQWMIRQLQPVLSDRFIEIGPGLGALTEWLLPLVGHVTVIEKDRKMVAFLGARFSGAENISICHEDACQTDLREFFPEGPCKLIGNLPYYVSTAILLNFLSAPTPVTHALFTVQKEVAERLAAVDGTSEYGSLSIAVQRCWQVKILRSLPPTVFYPEPHVDSAVVLLTARAPQELAPVDGETFEKMVRKGFSQRRKQLRKMLELELNAWTPLATTLGVSPLCRAEELSLAQWVQLVQMLEPPAKSQAQSPDEEIFDVVDASDEVVRQATRAEVHARDLLHRAVHILVFNHDGELFLQKRSHRKDREAGKWDSSAAGHLDAGENYLAAAKREIREELGIDAEVSFLEKLVATEQTGFEFVEIFEANSSGPFRLQPMEIETGAFFSLTTIQRWLAHRPEDFAPGFVACFAVLKNGF